LVLSALFNIVEVKEKYLSLPKEMRELIKGNITFPNLDCNDFIKGLKQNKWRYRSKVYQIIGYIKKYRKILMKAKPANSEDEKIFNYFLINTFEDLFKEYYKNNRKFLIGGEYKTIGGFKIFDNMFTNGGCTFVKGINYDTKLDYELTNGERNFNIKELEAFWLNY